MNTPLKELKLGENQELVNIQKVPSFFTISAIKADGTFDEGYEVKLDENSTLKSVLDDINKNSGVSAFYDSHTGKIALTTKNSGLSGTIEVGFGDGN